MGAVNSCCIPRRTFEECRENRISTPKGKGHRRNLSATFSFPTEDNDSQSNVVNINTATQEELMTLPGINRPTAQNIIEHRRQIGSFKKVEDVALVSGVGAAKLNNIRSEITVSRKNESKNGSPEGSVNIDINSVKEQVTTNSSTVVNINTANVFQFMKIKGVGQNLAENIVTYRDKKGPFKSLEDLEKVKAFGPGVLSAIKQYLTLESTTMSNDASHRHLNGGPPHDVVRVRDCGCIKGQMSRGSVENMLEVLGPLARKGQRPDVVPFNLKNKNRRVFRIASWNLQQLSYEKSSHIGVQDAVCMTILENGFGIVAVQEIADEKALENICDQLNNPTLPNVKSWYGRRGKWKSVVSQSVGRMYKSLEYTGFLYDTSQNIKIISSSLLEKAKSDSKALVRKPFFSVFKINNKFDCVIVSVHVKTSALGDEHLHKTKAEIIRIPSLVQAIEDHIAGERHIIILGDFNTSPASDEFKPLFSQGYVNCIPSSAFTNISNSNPEGSQSCDNIWLSKHTQDVYTGEHGVVRKGLTSPWIPKGWSWGGVVSDHCPVYVELYANQDVDNRNVLSGADGVHFTVGDS